MPAAPREKRERAEVYTAKGLGKMGWLSWGGFQASPAQDASFQLSCILSQRKGPEILLQAISGGEAHVLQGSIRVCQHGRRMGSFGCFGNPFRPPCVIQLGAIKIGSGIESNHGIPAHLSHIRESNSSCHPCHFSLIGENTFLVIWPGTSLYILGITQFSSIKVTGKSERWASRYLSKLNNVM